MNIPENVKDILYALKRAGFEAYVVGGAVRDSVLGENPHDWDITTSATPDEVKRVFNRVVDTGLKHGTVTVLSGKHSEGFEITTFRKDGEYSDGRHPDSVAFVSDVKEDLSRRDFTINAMAADAEGNVVDPFDGRKDLENKIIRCVGNPDKRFEEDALRMMRAIRFEGKYGFKLDDDTREAIKRNAHKIMRVSPERVRDELTKMLMSPNAKQAFVDLYETGLSNFILPEFTRIMECEQNQKAHYANVGMHTLDVVEGVPFDENIRWAALLHDFGKPAAKHKKENGEDSFKGHQEQSAILADTILKRLHFSNRDREFIDELVLYHDIPTLPMALYEIRDFVSKHDKHFLDTLVVLKMADNRAHNVKEIQKYIDRSKCFVSLAYTSLYDGTAIKMKDLKINGFDLRKMGFKDKEVGEVLDYLRLECLKRPENNTEEMLKMLAANYKNLDAHPGICDR